MASSGTANNNNIINNRKSISRPGKRPRKKRTKRPDVIPKLPEEPRLKKTTEFQKPARKRIQITDLPYEITREIIDYCPDLDFISYRILRDSPAFKFLDKYYLPITNIRKPENLICFRSIYNKSQADYLEQQVFKETYDLHSIVEMHLNKYNVKANEVTVFLEYEEEMSNEERYERLLTEGNILILTNEIRYLAPVSHTDEIIQYLTNGFKKTWIYFRKNYTKAKFEGDLNNPTTFIINYEAFSANTFAFEEAVAQEKRPELKILKPPKIIKSDNNGMRTFSGTDTKYTSYIFKADFYDLEEIDFYYCIKSKESLKLNMIPNVKKIKLSQSPYFLNHINNFQNYELHKLESLIIDGTPMCDFTRCSFPALKSLVIKHKTCNNNRRKGFNLRDNYLPKLERLELHVKPLQCFFGNTFGINTLNEVSLCIDTGYLTGRSSIADILQQATKVKISQFTDSAAKNDNSDAKYYCKVFKSFNVKINRIESLILIGMDLEFVHDVLGFQKMANLKSLKIMKCKTNSKELLSIPPFFKNLETLWLIFTSIQRLVRIPASLKHLVFSLPEILDKSGSNSYFYKDHRFTGAHWVHHYAVHGDVFTAPDEIRNPYIGTSAELFFIDHKYIHENHGKSVEFLYHSRLPFDETAYKNNLKELGNGSDRQGKVVNSRTLLDLLKPISTNSSATLILEDSTFESRSGESVHENSDSVGPESSAGLASDA